jgi:indolepyruvate ferredoxin oxidoreductase
MSAPGDKSVPLWQRYTAETGRVHLTGLQALVRLPLEQVRRDRRAGLRVGAFYSGYPGSPLGGLDQTLRSVEPLLRAEDVHFAPALNEELAASAVGGSQLIDLFPHSQYDGALGLWFGKSPGLDRAIDVLRHSNFVGTSRYGGALALVGDDPFCKSSSLPSHCELAFAHAFVPVFYPSDAREVLELGRHAFAISRYAGLWVGMKIVADVADGGGIFELPEDGEIVLPKFDYKGAPFEKRLDPGLLPPNVNRIEEELLYARLEAVTRYADENGLNPTPIRHDRDRVGIVSSGRLYRELRTALELMGLREPDLERLGLRVMQIQMLYPVEPRSLQRFADGLDEIIVLDERRGFLEDQLRASLFNSLDRPMVIGQRDEQNRPWLARHAEISAETVALDLADHLAQRLGDPQLSQRADVLRAVSRRTAEAARPSRAPQFCSGCPHSKSTKLPEGSVAGGGIGCHTMAILMDRDVKFFGAMGSEGSQWIGLEAFVDTPHLFQNLGDGTYFHSGRLAVRACVEARVNLTFKLLYNGVIAMTGAQQAVGAKSLAAIAADLLNDGVALVIAASSDRHLLEMARTEKRLEVVPLDRFDDAARKLRELPGVSVLIYDEICANQKHRLQRRGELPAVTSRIVINEDVCEGCGDCGRKSTCASLRPVPTALGRKTRLHQISCTDDRSCLAGDCPAFTSIELAAPARASTRQLDDWRSRVLPEPALAEIGSAEWGVMLVGVGATGIVTADAILLRAAEIQGLHALHLDQTGLAQRGGKVVSHCRLSREPLTGSPRVACGSADVLIGLDPLCASDSVSLRSLDPKRTRSIVHDVFDPTGRMIAHPEEDYPEVADMLENIAAQSRSMFVVRAEALADVSFGSGVGANVVMLGAALQRGLLPLSVGAIEGAIRDRGVATEANLLALQLGRAVADDPKLADRLLEDAMPPSVGEDGDPERTAALLGPEWRGLATALNGFARGPERERLIKRVAGWAADLVDYQDHAYARRYLACLEVVALAETRIAQAPALSEAAARELYRLMAYKDEYEVARLLLRGPFRRWQERVRERSGGGRIRRRYFLHPPLLRRLGLRHKISIGRIAEPVLACLVAVRRLRGSGFDPFGLLASRRAERALIDWYIRLLADLATRLTAGTRARATEIAALASQLRGFEDVKTARIEALQRRAAAGLADLERG